MRKHISYRSAELLNALNSQNIQFFTIRNAKDILRNSSEEAVRRLLIYMAQRGLLLRIKDGLYNIIPYERDSNDYFPNWHLTAEALVKPKNYYIGFYSALDIHGLITQPSLKEQIIVNKQIIPKHHIVKNVKFEFITINKKRFFGIEKTWIDDFNKINCSDIEKTILDCLYKPNYANGIAEIIKAIYRSKQRIKPGKMIDYLDKYNVQAVYKRLGFLLHKLDILQPITNEIQNKISSSYTFLDTSLPKEGKHNSVWKIIDNADINSIIKSIET